MSSLKSDGEVVTVPRPAATVVIVRNAAAGGIEILLLHRGDAKDYNSGAWVFPGGVLDAADGAVQAFCSGLDDASASRRLGLPRGGLDFYVASIRECFEESGLLLATSDPPKHGMARAAAAPLSDWRRQLRTRTLSFQELCKSAGLRLLTDQVHYFSHWITPVGMPKRYDTRFFIAPAPADQEVMHDGEELIAHRWISPAAALHHSSELRLLNATRSVLESLTGHDRVAGVLAWASGLGSIPTILPRLALGQSGRRAVLPQEEAWAEVGRLDPQGRCTASYDINPDTAVRLSERITRVTARHPTDPTLHGRNTYLIGGGPDCDWAVIDPASPDPLHLDAVVAAAGGPIRWIVLTDAPPDNTAAAVALAARLNATFCGPPLGREMHAGACLDVNPGARLRCVTASAHESLYVLEQEHTLLAGETLVTPSLTSAAMLNRDLSDTLESLRMLAREQLDWLAPSRGFLVADPQRTIAAALDAQVEQP